MFCGIGGWVALLRGLCWWSVRRGRTVGKKNTREGQREAAKVKNACAGARGGVGEEERLGFRFGLGGRARLVCNWERDACGRGGGETRRTSVSRVGAGPRWLPPQAGLGVCARVRRAEARRRARCAARNVLVPYSDACAFFLDGRVAMWGAADVCGDTSSEEDEYVRGYV